LKFFEKNFKKLKKWKFFHYENVNFFQTFWKKFLKVCVHYPIDNELFGQKAPKSPKTQRQWTQTFLKKFASAVSGLWSILAHFWPGFGGFWSKLCVVLPTFLSKWQKSEITTISALESILSMPRKSQKSRKTLRVSIVAVSCLWLSSHGPQTRRRRRLMKVLTKMSENTIFGSFLVIFG